MKTIRPSTHAFRINFLACALFSAALAGCSKSPAELQKKYQGLGEHYLAEGKLNEAVIEFQNLLKINPRSPRGHFDLAQAYHKKGWLIESVIQDREATKLDPLMLPAHMALAEYAVNSGQWNPAKDEIASVLKIDPNNPEGWVLAGQRMLGLGREEEADRDLKRALSIKPGYPRGLVALGDLKRKQKKDKEAQEDYERALSADPSLGRALTGLGLLAQSQRDNPLAQTEFKKALSVDPDNLRSRIVYANFLAATGHLHKAIHELADIPSKKADLRIPVKIAEYRTLLGENAKAIAILLPLAQQKIPVPDISFVLAKAYQQSGKKEDALHQVDRLLSINGVPPILKIGAARIDLIEGKPQDARNILQTLRKIPDLPVAYALTESQVDLALNHPKKATAILSKSLSQVPDNVSLLLAMTDTLAFRKQWAAAIHNVNRLLASHPDNQDAILRKAAILSRMKGANVSTSFLQEESAAYPVIEPYYLQALAGNGKTKEALSKALVFLKDHPANGSVRFFLANLYQKTGRLKKARQNYETILSNDPKNLQAVVALASIAVTEKNYPEAESNFRRALTFSPDNSGLYSALGEVLLAENQRDAANKAFQSALMFNPDNPAAILEVSKADILAGQGQEALAYLTPLLKAHFTKQRMAEVEWLWGLANEGTRNPEKVWKALSLAVKLDPNNPGYHASLGDFLAEESQWKKAKAEYVRSLSLSPDNPILKMKKNWIAVQSVTKPDLNRIRKVVREAATYRTTHPEDVSAGILEAQGDLLLKNPEKALSVFNAILSTHPDNTGARLGKAGILLGQKENGKAKEIVASVLADHPDNLSANFLMANIDQQTRDFNDEADRLEKLHQKHPDWIQPSLALISVDLSLNRFQEAQSISESILSIRPDTPNARYLKSQAELGMGDYRAAIQDLQILVKSSKKPASLYLLMSVAAMKEGNLQEEKSYLDLAYRAAPQNPTVLNNMAFYLASHTTHFAKALLLAKKAVTLNKQPFVLDTVGYVLFRMGNFDQAQSYFDSAWKARFRDPEFLYHMGMNEWKMGKNQKARSILRKALASGKLTPEEERASRIALGQIGA